MSAQGRTDAGGGGDGGGGQKEGKNGDGWTQTWVLRSRAFENYYQAMGIMDKEEWPVFMHALRQPLPACFRIHSDCTFKEEVKKQLLEYLSAPMLIEGKEVKAVQELPWYGGGLAYRLGCDRRFIRKQPHLAEFHHWLTELMESGNLTRQEAVSMLPPLFLDVKPRHVVLDLCAAPGSKTAQLIEMVSAPADDGATANVHGKFSGDVGLVVANDSDRDRAYMLAHQCKRVKSPAIAITWCPAQGLPNLGAQERGGDKGVFDRVLADVPCSGDGTLRKQPSIWRTWTVSGGLGLHPLQLLITLRGASMLKIGGKMVYSTCSLNPIEDEAVVAETLRRCGGYLQLVDCHSMLPGLKTRPGIHTWPVLTGQARFKGVKTTRAERNRDASAVFALGNADADGSGDACGAAVESDTVAEATPDDATTATYEDATGEEEEDAAAVTQKKGVAGQGGQGCDYDGDEGPAVASEFPLEEAIKAGLRHHPSFAEVDTVSSRKMRPSFFPPSPKQAKELKLERCMRMLPQDQDTGGFFVAVLVKTGPILWNDLLAPGENLDGDEEPTAIPISAVDKKNAKSDAIPSTETTAASDDDANPVIAATSIGSSSNISSSTGNGKDQKGVENGGLANTKTVLPGGRGVGAESSAPLAPSDGNGMEATAATTATGSGVEAGARNLTMNAGTDEGARWGRGGRGAGLGRGRGRGRGRGNAACRPQDAEKEEYVPMEADQWPQIRRWFGIGDDFPVDRLYTRKAGSRSISYVAPTARRYVLDDAAGSRLQLVHTGVKVFERNNNARSAIEFRVCQEGLGLVLPYMTLRVARNATAGDLSRALDGHAVPMELLSAPTQKALEGQEEGIFVFTHTMEATGRVFSACVWKGRGNTIASMINKDLLSGLKLEMRAFGVYVPKNDHNEVKADDPVGTTKTSMDASPSPDDVVDDAGADASGEGAVESNANDVSAAATKAPEI